MILALLLWAAVSPVRAEEPPIADTVGDPAFALKRHPDRPRNAFFPPLYSYFVPGLDQWIEGQTPYAAVYSVIGGAGFILASESGAQVDTRASLTDKNWPVEEFLLGNSFYESGNGLSAYHSFRSAVRTRRQLGEYGFLDPAKEESPNALAVAAFDFTYLTRPTTFIPLGLLSALAYLSVHGGGQHWYGLGGAQYAVSGAASYGAGMGEEAAFRGYLQPWLREQTGSGAWSDLIASAVFGAAHYASDNQVPITQFLFGVYLGIVCEKNDWTLGENVFIHTWWDVLAFIEGYGTTQGRIHPPVGIQIPIRF